MTQENLARTAGLTQNYLSDIQNGKRIGPAATLSRLSMTLRVPLALLVK